MIIQDRKEREKGIAKNAVEAYVYDMRGKLFSEYEKFITEEVSYQFDFRLFIYAIELEIQGSRLEVMLLMVYRYELFLGDGNVFYVLFRFLFLYKYSFYLLIPFVSTVQARTKFEQTLEETENWLYEDGEDQSKKVYQDKLDELKVNLFSRKY